MDTKGFNKLAHKTHLLNCYRTSLINQIKIVREQSKEIKRLKEEIEQIKELEQPVKV